MAKNFKIVHTGVGNWRKGDVVNAKHIEDADALGGLKRLQELGAVEETDDDVTIERPEGAVQMPEQTKGDNVDPGSDDDVHKRAKRREEAVGKGNTGMPGAATGENLSELTVADLHERAKAAGVEGYSTMHKDELVKAVRKAEKK